MKRVCWLSVAASYVLLIGCQGGGGEGGGSGGSSAGTGGVQASNAGGQSAGGGDAEGGNTEQGGQPSGGAAPAGGGVSGGGGMLAGGAGAMGVYQIWPFDEAEAKRRQQETAATLGLKTEIDIDLGGDVKMTMVLIPAGYSRLGALPGDTGFETDESRHAFTALVPFYIGKTPVTQAQYNALLKGLPDAMPMSGGAQLPALQPFRRVIDVVLPALQTHAPARWVFRLTTQDEWEYAARAGTITMFYTGNTMTALDMIAWFSGNSGGQLHEVGQKLPNAWNVHDMIGNAWHWALGNRADANPSSTQLVRGCSRNDGLFGNGCRTSNKQISAGSEQYRFVADVPLP